MENTSVWMRGIEFPQIAALAEDMRTDVLIVGAGLCGLLTANALVEAGARSVCVIDAAEIGGRVSRHTTAKITAQHGLIYDALIQGLGEALAGQYARANQEAIAAYARLIREAAIDCDFTQSDAHVYTREEKRRKDLEREAKAAQKLGIDARIEAESEIPLPIAATLVFPGQAHFHPVKFLRALIERLQGQGVRLFAHTALLPTTAPDTGIAHTTGGDIRYETLVLCSHYPVLDKPGKYFLRMTQSRSYAVALEGVTLRAMHIDVDENGLSFRPYADGIILGSGAHKTGHECDRAHYAPLYEQAKALYEREPVAAWSAQDCMTLDNIPYIGRYAQLGQNAYIATGFHKWGMTSSMAAANLLAQAITTGQAEYADVFAPGRDNYGMQTKTFLSESFDNAAQYIGGVVSDRPSCTHMGCPLKRNEEEGNWECPCHGSRFSEAGAVLNGPALRPIDVL